eukprot:799829-Prymnesium_polylepis.1
MGALVPTVVDGAVAWRFALEYVMSMGAHLSSRNAQRFANEMIAILLARFDEADVAHLENESEAVRAAIARRRSMAHSEMATMARLADAAQFTDDPLIGA